MPTGLQPANRKLLDDATADARYRTAAQVDTAADARAAAAITAQKGAASGLASLGADGKVPATQLPPGAAPATLQTANAVVTYWRTLEGVVMVRLNGTCPSAGSVLATLPAGYRPGTVAPGLASYTFSGILKMAYAEVRTNGDVVVTTYETASDNANSVLLRGSITFLAGS